MPFTLGPHSSRVCDELSVETDMSTLKVRAAEWDVQLRGMPVYRRVRGPSHRIDVKIKQKVGDAAFAAQPHGIIGQSFDGNSTARRGKLDVYPSRSLAAEFTTTAWAEGAIEGVANEYAVGTRYATDFKYSRFDARRRPTAAAGDDTLGEAALFHDEDGADMPPVAAA